MAVGQQQVVDIGRIKTEILRIFLLEFMASLVQPAVDENAFAAAFNQVAGSGDAAVGAMKRNLHTLSVFLSGELPHRVSGRQP